MSLQILCLIRRDQAGVKLTTGQVGSGTRLDDVVLQSIVLVWPFDVPSSGFSWQHFRRVLCSRRSGAGMQQSENIYLNLLKRWFAVRDTYEPGSWHSLSSSFLATSIFCACTSAAGRTRDCWAFLCFRPGAATTPCCMQSRRFVCESACAPILPDNAAQPHKHSKAFEIGRRVLRSHVDAL